MIIKWSFFINKLFCIFSGIDNEWMSQKPYYGILMDKLKENEKLPECDNYKEYKAHEIKSLDNLQSTQNDIIYTRDGKALKLLKQKISDVHILFKYEDVTQTLDVERLYNELNIVHAETLEHSIQPLVVYHQSGKIKMCNIKFQEFFKIKDIDINDQMHCTDLVEKYYKPLLKKKFRQDLAAQILYSIQNSKSQHLEFEAKGYEKLEIHIHYMQDNTAQVYHDFVK